jgi:hypothetical protein
MIGGPAGGALVGAQAAGVIVIAAAVTRRGSGHGPGWPPRSGSP